MDKRKRFGTYTKLTGNLVIAWFDKSFNYKTGNSRNCLFTVKLFSNSKISSILINLYNKNS
mgnify:CR=1 FL=1